MTISLDEQIEQPPERIYLQAEDGYHSDTTWCRDKINDEDIEYVRAQRGESGLPEEPMDEAIYATSTGIRYFPVSYSAALRTFAERAVGQIDTLRQELAAAKDKIERMELSEPHATRIMFQNRAEKAEAALAESRKDAARYRWLRAGQLVNRIKVEQFEFPRATWELITNDELDAAIDAQGYKP